MTRVFKAKELKVTTDNKPGQLAKVTAPIAEARVNVNACCAYAMDDKAEFLFVTADNEKVKECLSKAGYTTTEREVVVLETQNETGALFRAAQQLAQADVDLEYCYATTANTPGGATWIIFATQTIEKAMNVIP